MMSKDLKIESMIDGLIEQTNPESIIQVGLSSSRSIRTLCNAAVQQEGILVTLIEPLLYEKPEYGQVLQQLRADALDQGVDFMATYADQVLPDLYFQALSFDLMVLNPCRTYEETFVAYYYLDKMLPCNRFIIIEQANDPIMRRLLRHMLSNSGYRVHTCFDGEAEMPKLERLLREQYARIPAFVRQRVEDFIRPEILVTDEELGINGTLMVLEKLREEQSPFTGDDLLLDAIA